MRMFVFIHDNVYLDMTSHVFIRCSNANNNVCVDHCLSSVNTII